MNRKKLLLIFIILILQSFLLLGCVATPDPSIVWSDDFDDKELEGWDTWFENGRFFIEDGVLTSTRAGDVYHTSTVSYGTWRFDLYLDDNTGTTHEFRFTEGTYNFQNLEIKQTQNTQVWITTQKDGSEPVSSYLDLGEKLSGWHHFDITKTESGLIKVYLDGEYLLEHFDERSFDAEGLVIMHCCSGPVLDNLEVRDQIIDIKP